MPTTAVCCYPVEEGFVARVRDLVLPALAEAARAGKPRLLFSAHGLPKKVVAGGDPYQWQVEQSAAAVARAIGQEDSQALDANTLTDQLGLLALVEGASTADALAALGFASEQVAATFWRAMTDVICMINWMMCLGRRT